MIWQTKPGYRENCYFIFKPFLIQTLKDAPIFSHHLLCCLMEGTFSEPLSCLRKGELVLHVLFIGWSLCAFGSSQNKVQSCILSLKNFADGLRVHEDPSTVQWPLFPLQESSAGSPHRAQWSQTFILASRKLFLKSAWNLVSSHSLGIFNEMQWFFLTIRQ